MECRQGYPRGPVKLAVVDKAVLRSPFSGPRPSGVVKSPGECMRSSFVMCRRRVIPRRWCSCSTYVVLVRCPRRPQGSDMREPQRRVSPQGRSRSTTATLHVEPRASHRIASSPAADAVAGCTSSPTSGAYAYNVMSPTHSPLRPPSAAQHLSRRASAFSTMALGPLSPLSSGEALADFTEYALHCLSAPYMPASSPLVTQLCSTSRKSRASVAIPPSPSRYRSGA